jgi:hypothetical protein
LNSCPLLAVIVAAHGRVEWKTSELIGFGEEKEYEQLYRSEALRESDCG